MGLFHRTPKSISLKTKTKTARYLECLYFGPALMDVAPTDENRERGIKYTGSMREPPRDEKGRVTVGEWISDPRLPLPDDKAFGVDPTSIQVVPFPNDYIGVYGIRTYTWVKK